MTEKAELKVDWSKLAELLIQILVNYHGLTEEQARKSVEAHPHLIEEGIQATAHRIAAKRSDEDSTEKKS